MLPEGPWSVVLGMVEDRRHVGPAKARAEVWVLSRRATDGNTQLRLLPQPSAAAEEVKKLLLSSCRRYPAWALVVGEAGRDTAEVAASGTPPTLPQPPSPTRLPRPIAAPPPQPPPDAAPPTEDATELRREAAGLLAAAKSPAACMVLEVRLLVRIRR